MKTKQREKISRSMRGSGNPNYDGGSKSADSRDAIRSWEKATGKQLPKGYMLHHRDGNPENNGVDNLQLVSRSRHNTMTKKGKTLGQQAKGHDNKPNMPEKQRRYR